MSRSRSGSLGGAGDLFAESLDMAGRSLSRKKEQDAFDGYGGDEVNGIPRVSYGHFLREFVWLQGEHVTAIGTTGSGKTTLMLELLLNSGREYIATLGTKAKDDTMSDLLKRGFVRVPDWSQVVNQKRVVVWPDITRVTAKEVRKIQSLVFEETMESIYQEGGWCLYLDELRVVTEYLNLGGLYELLMQQGRSIGISIVAANQRPRHIPLVAYDQATHLFFWRENDEENLKRVAGIGWTDRTQLQKVISSLKRFEFLYLNTRTGEMMISKVNKRR